MIESERAVPDDGKAHARRIRDLRVVRTMLPIVLLLAGLALSLLANMALVIFLLWQSSHMSIPGVFDFTFGENGSLLFLGVVLVALTGVWFWMAGLLMHARKNLKLCEISRDLQEVRLRSEFREKLLRAH